ncbi:MAG: RdgB/HAM1 family non-canonical purine NTP pyrophosphatase [Bacilli bacterium]|nr:RdgB/HAM1 family non-canonical purine NTP pyrophosphatase [Bacilli bacterium]
MNFEIVLATNNKHKLQEVRSFLSPHKIVVYGLNDLNLKVEDVEENASTYQGNALIKAQAVAKLTSFPVIADDSGLEIEALDNIPGLKSARFASSLGGHDNAIKEILKRLEDKNNRKARFICDIVLVNDGDKPLLFEGIAEGEITKERDGNGGFGYDPIFYSYDAKKRFSELSEEEKNRVSHRGKALYKLLTYLRITHQSIK